MRRFPVLVGSHDIYRGRVVNLRVDTIEVADGENVRREVVEHPGAVVLVPVDSEGRLLWVRQYRYAVDRELLELPAGTLERGEAPEACARREVAEETGFEAGSLEMLGSFFTAPGFCTEYMHAYAATGLTPARDAHADDDEDIQVEPLTIEEALARIDEGAIVDAKSIAALFLYLRKHPR
ncbi:MAG TPA: NUDIX hydrolase [Dehalococcoidia bacterium]|nr:NUDIX hydrolase [Dehalococcoidia bacterium]